MKTYIPRISDAILSEELAGMGAVLVQGAKWCGKTTTCEQLAKTEKKVGNVQQTRLLLTFRTEGG